VDLNINPPPKKNNKAMNKYFFQQLSEKVRKAEIKSVNNFEFDEVNFENETFKKAFFEIHKTPNADYYVRFEDGKFYLTKEDDTICQITGIDAEKWQNTANELFWAQHADDIEEAKQESQYWSWVDFQDAMGEIQRHW